MQLNKDTLSKHCDGLWVQAILEYSHQLGLKLFYLHSNSVQVDCVALSNLVFLYDQLLLESIHFLYSHKICIGN